jgi:hypothetical protein
MTVVVAGTLPNLVNVTKRMDPDGTVAKIAELLEQANPILQDIPMIEGNLPTGHRTTIRSDTPTPTWRKLNYGVLPTKSATTQVDDTIGMLEAFSEVDKDLAMLNGNTAEFRMSEDTPHLEGMSQTMASTIFYGDTGANPERFLGLAPRYDDLALASKPAATTPSAHLDNIIDLYDTAATNMTSMWSIVWGESTVHGIYPKGSNAGLLAEDRGEVLLSDAANGRFIGFQSHYQWKMGMCVRDWRYIVRIANINLLKLDDATYQKTLYQAMIKAMHAVPATGRGNGVFYAGSAVSAMLDMAAVEKANAALGMTEVFGQPVMSFRGRPIRNCDAILETEVRVT